ncbi:MAG: phosphotransferase [Rhodobacteraceae bacterium]|nr:phosphotransferase [Paracoccaceae bacterium]
MSQRADLAAAFVATTDWAGALLRPLASDAGKRAYFRLISPAGHKAVLMDASPEKGEDVRPFLTIDRWLTGQGLSAPEIYAEDTANGFLLIEDLGDGLYARLADQDAALEQPIYEAAIDALLEITTAEPPTVDPYDAETMAPLAGLAGSWYAGDAALAEEIARATGRALASLAPAPPTLALRDFHAENLLWLPDRKGAARVGLLDFQDARRGHPAYDVASLLRDARRDVPQRLQTILADRFGAGLGWDRDETTRALAVQGAQRNLRILGVFARLSLHFSKPHYVDLIPRVWQNLQTELSHPDLTELRQVASQLPTPSTPHLQDLKDRCGTIPTLA